MSRSRVDKLGKQLAAEGAVRAEHLALFSQILEYYGQLLNTVARRLSECGYAPSTRVKTTGTLIEKLRRHHGLQLSHIQDVAGARIVVGPLRAEQDQAVNRILKEFEYLERAPSVTDRRMDPRYGYRAVHIIVYPEGVPIEIQVRTELQDLWAQMFESVADQWGRQIRYGEPPDRPSSLAFTLESPGKTEQINRREIIEVLSHLSDRAASYEVSIAKFAATEELLASVPTDRQLPVIGNLHNIVEKHGLIPEVKAKIKKSYNELRALIIAHYDLTEPDKRRRGRIIRRRCPKRDNPEIGDCDNLVRWFLPIAKEDIARRRLNIARQGDELRGILAVLAQGVDEVI